MDLVYGHLGEPVYDTDSKTWHFARDIQTKKYFSLLCTVMEAKEIETNAPSGFEARELEKSLPGMYPRMLQ